MVAQRAHDFQIVADEQVGEIVTPLEIAQEIDDLRLDAHVQCAGRLVEHDELGTQHHGPGNGDALALPAGEFMRIAVLAVGIEPHLAQGLSDAMAALLIGQLGLLDEQAFLDDLADGQAWGERAVGILEDDLHFLAQGTHLLLCQTVDTIADIGDGPLGGNQSQQSQAERRLARARLANDAKRLSGAQLQRQAVDGLDVIDGALQQARLDREPDLEIVGFDDDGAAFVGLGRIALRLGVDQVARVGMLRIGEDLFHLAFLDDLAGLHHIYALGHLADDAQVVGDEQHGHAHLFAQIGEKLQDLRLDGDIEGGGRFVGDQQFGLVGERHGDHHALTLAARQFVRIGTEPLFRFMDADFLKQFEDALPGAGVVHAAVQLQDLADLPLDGVQRVQRRHGLLEDDGDAVAADRLHVAVGNLQQVLALEEDLTRGMGRHRIGKQAQDGQRGDGFSGARFANERDGFAAADAERDAVDGERLSVALAEGDGEVADLNQRFRRAHGRSPIGRSCAGRGRRARPRR